MTLLLLLSVAAVAQPTGRGEYTSDMFTDPTSCGKCHGEEYGIYSQWNGSVHSLAFEDILYRAEVKMAGEEAGSAVEEFCERCHTPIGVVSGEVPPFDNPNMSVIAKKGVQCDFCHTVSNASGVGNGAYVSSPGNVKRGPFTDAVSPFHETAYSDLHTKAEFCGMCHDVNHPVNGLPIEATYTEWKEGPYNTGDPSTTTPCQHCHMTPGVTRFQKNPGTAAIGGPMRDHIYTHDVYGGNAIIPSPRHRELAINRLRSAATLEVITPETVGADETVTVRVKVNNVGAGHYLPTGLTEIRQMWLHVKVTDGTGRVIYESGALDGEGSIDPNAVIYHTVLGDKDGKPTNKVWEAESILSDHRVPPKGSQTEDYTFVVPEDATAPITVDVRLNYRSAPQSLVNDLLGEGELEVPVIEMTSASATFGIGISFTLIMYGLLAAATVAVLLVAYLRLRRQ